MLVLHQINSLETMNEKIAELMERSVNTTDRKKIKGLWRRILAQFAKNQDQIIKFLQEGTDQYDQERILRNIRAMPDRPFYPITIINLKGADSVDGKFLLNEAVAHDFRKIRDRKLKFRLLRKISLQCEEECEQLLIVELLETMRLPSTARLLVRHLRGPDNMDFTPTEDPEILEAFVTAIEKLTLD